MDDDNLLARLTDCRTRLHHAEGETLMAEAIGEIGRLRQTIAQMADAEVRAEDALIRERDEAMKAAQQYKQERDQEGLGHYARIAHIQALLEQAEGERAELSAWQEKVCQIIQPAETPDEWGADVADIIQMRERERREAKQEAGGLRQTLMNIRKDVHFAYRTEDSPDKWALLCMTIIRDIDEVTPSGTAGARVAALYTAAWHFVVVAGDEPTHISSDVHNAYDALRTTLRAVASGGAGEP